MRIHGCVLLLRAVHIGRYVSITCRVRARADSGTASHCSRFQGASSATCASPPAAASVAAAEGRGGMAARGTETSATASLLRTGGIAQQFWNENGTGPGMPAAAASVL